MMTIAILAIAILAACNVHDRIEARNRADRAFQREMIESHARARRESLAARWIDVAR